MDFELLNSLVSRKLTVRLIAKELNCSPTTVRYWIQKYQLKLYRAPSGKLPKDYVKPRHCKCGETDPKMFYGNKNQVCAKCHKEKTLERGRDNRDYALAKFGRKCKSCGFDKYKSSFDIHHTDPSIKDLNFKNFKYWSKERIDAELESCILLCKNCHTAFHNKELII